MKRFSLRRKRRWSAVSLQKKLALPIVMTLALVLMPAGAANADTDGPSFPDIVKAVKEIPSWLGSQDAVQNGSAAPGLPPEVYGSGFDGMAGLHTYAKDQTPQDWSRYGQYGTAGLYWNWVGVGSFDFATPIGNQVANLIFNLAKTIDTVTITVYSSASSGSIVKWLKDETDKLITGIGKALKVGYLTLVVTLGALTLIWWGLFKRRATKVAEGTIWMVCAAAAFLILINRPEIFTSSGEGITSAADKIVGTAISPLEGTAATGGKTQVNGRQNPTVCVPDSSKGSPQNTGRWGTGKDNTNATVNKNVNTMWSVLVCKPWLQGEFGTSNPNSQIVKAQAGYLLYGQAYTRNDIIAGKVNPAKGQQKLKDFYQAADAAKSAGAGDLFTGKLYTQRIGIAFAALIAALIAGLLLLLLSLALIIFKLGFFLLLITGPVFLLIGVHPGAGRVIAVRWVELLLSTLLKQALIAALLGLLLFLYALIMGSGLSWVIEIMLIALVSFAAFFYRKPFQHLFAAVGTDSIGSRILSNATTGSNVFKTGTAPLTVPSRVNKWTLRKAQPLTDAAAATGHPVGMAIGMASRMATGNATDDDVSGRTAGRISAASNGDGSGPGTGRTTTGARTGTNAPPLNLPRGGNQNGPTGPGETPRGGIRPGGGPTTVGPRPGPDSSDAPALTGAGWGPRPGEAPPIWKPHNSGGSSSRHTPSAPQPTGPGPRSGGGGSSSGSGGAGWFGSSWRRSGGAAAGPSGPSGPNGPSGGGSRRPGGGGGGWFGGSSRDGGATDPAPPPPRRTENRDNSSGPAPWRKQDKAPPLWAKPSKPPAPDIPFWTRPDK